MSKNSSLSMFSVNIIDTFFRYVHPKVGELPRFNGKERAIDTYPDSVSKHCFREIFFSWELPGVSR